MRRLKGRLQLEDFKKIRKYNEVDLVQKMRKVLADAEVLAEKVVDGNKTAMNELRKFMNDNVNLSNILRDMVRVRMGNATENKQLISTIKQEKVSMAYKQRQDKQASAEVMKEKIRRVKLAEENLRIEREQKREEERGASDGQH